MEGYIPAPEYHNQDPLVRLIGPANEGKVKIEGVEMTALIDTGACMSAITKSFAEALELDLKPLDSVLDIEGTGGGKVPYHGYVECRLNLPQVEKFDHDVLMLVIDDSQYGARVPIQIGTLHIDMCHGSDFTGLFLQSEPTLSQNLLVNPPLTALTVEQFL